MWILISQLCTCNNFGSSTISEEAAIRRPTKSFLESSVLIGFVKFSSRKELVEARIYNLKHKVLSSLVFSYLWNFHPWCLFLNFTWMLFVFGAWESIYCIYSLGLVLITAKVSFLFILSMQMVHMLANWSPVNLFFPESAM